ncbi:MAG: hypothetical protein ACKVOQ_08055 [Cyclobacteriaceae bacterium]
MIKTVVIPENNDLHLTLPNSYIGKEIEVLLYSKEEVSEGKNENKKDAARFKGLLTNEEADKFHVCLKQARNEWDRDI